MARVKRGVTSHAKHKKVLKAAKPPIAAVIEGEAKEVAAEQTPSAAEVAP